MQQRSRRIVNKRELAEVFGVSAQAIDGWLSRGCPVVKRGGPLVGYQFDTAAVAEWRAEQRVAEAVAGNKPEGQDDADRRIACAEASLKELKLARELGQLVTIDDVSRVWVQMIAACRTRMLAVPSKVAALAHGAEDVESARAAIEEEVHEALNELADNGIPEDAPDSDGGIAESGEPGAFDDQASAEADPERMGGVKGKGSVRQRRSRTVPVRKG